jgi:hypothetical protein
MGHRSNKIAGSCDIIKKKRANGAALSFWGRNEGIFRQNKEVFAAPSGGCVKDLRAGEGVPAGGEKRR